MLADILERNLMSNKKPAVDIIMQTHGYMLTNLFCFVLCAHISLQLVAVIYCLRNVVTWGVTLPL